MTKLFFISPHLDDAAFSLGSYMSKARSRNKLVVVNVFTRGGLAHTLSARAFLHQCQVGDVNKLFALRRREDNSALHGIGAKVIDWGYIDALWRRKSKKSNLPAEFGSIYPTYRWHVVGGKVSRHDDTLIHELQQKLLTLISGAGSDYHVYCPLGVGNHVDHLLVRAACEAVVPPTRLVYWLDFPYSIRSGVELLPPPAGYVPRVIPTSISVKKSLCRAYKSQYSLVIPDEGSLTNPETIYVYDPKIVTSPKLHILQHVKALLTCPKDYIYSALKRDNNLTHPVRPFSTKLERKGKELLTELSTLLSGSSPRLIGSASIGVAGVGDLDIIIGSDIIDLSSFRTILTTRFGSPSHTTSTMSQWKIVYRGTKVDLDLMTYDNPRYYSQFRLADILGSHPVDAARYEVFKYHHKNSRGMVYEVARMLFFHDIITRHQQVMPLQIRNYKLVKQIQPDPRFPGSYHFGIYQSPSGKQVFAKLWLGHAHGRVFKFMQNEIAAYQGFAKLSSLGKVSVPEIVDSGITHDYTYLILPRLVGKSLQSVSTTSRANYFDQIISFLNVANLNFKVSSRPPVFWLLILPVLLFKNKLKYLWAISNIIKSVPAFLFRPIVLVHRDLNFQNMILAKSHIYLIDFQLACYADPILEYAVILLKYYNDPTFIKAFKKKPNFRKTFNTPTSRSILKSYMLILSLYDLTLSDGRHSVTRELLNDLKTRGRIV